MLVAYIFPLDNMLLNTLAPNDIYIYIHTHTHTHIYVAFKSIFTNTTAVRSFEIRLY